MDAIETVPIWRDKVVLKLSPLWDSAWKTMIVGKFEGEVVITTDSFTATLRTLFYTDELNHLRDGLARLHRALTGQMECVTQNGLTLRLEFIDNRGHLQWTISSTGNPMLSFGFYSDQTELLPAIEHLERFLAEDAKRLNSKHRKPKSK